MQRLAWRLRNLGAWLFDVAERLDPTPELPAEEFDRMRAAVLLAKRLLDDDPWAMLKEDMAND